jgi:small-conductance mechanosensitive channel
MSTTTSNEQATPSSATSAGATPTGEARASVRPTRPGTTSGWVLMVLAVVVGAVSGYVFASTLTEQLLTTGGAFATAELLIRLGLSMVGLVLAFVADRLARPRPQG